MLYVVMDRQVLQPTLSNQQLYKSQNDTSTTRTVCKPPEKLT